MKCEIQILSGAREGQREVLDKAYIGLGRHPMSDVRFDAEHDLDASTRHAAILLTGSDYTLRDLGSTNGTFVNGEKVTGDVPLTDGDVIKCGVHGPEVAFHILRDQEEMVIQAVRAPTAGATPRTRNEPRPPPATAAPASAAAPKSAPAAAGTPGTVATTGQSKTSILRAEIQVQRSRFRALTVMLLIIMVGAASILVWQARSAQQAVGAVVAQRDSITRELAQILAAKQNADSQVARLQRSLAAETDPGRRAAIQVRIGTAETRRQHIAAAETVNFTPIRTGNDRAVAIVYVQFEDTMQSFTGTAFSVTPEGVLLTNRHVITGPRGERPTRVAVQFSGSAEVLRAHVVRTAPTSDIAVLQLDEAGPFPTVAGFAPDAELAEGTPIALIGFPGGGGEGTVPRATLVSGFVLSIVPDSLIQMDAFSGTGASGSPIFDTAGRVIGIEFGGIRESGGRTVLGLPIRRAMGLIGR